MRLEDLRAELVARAENGDTIARDVLLALAMIGLAAEGDTEAVDAAVDALTDTEARAALRELLRDMAGDSGLLMLVIGELPDEDDRP